MLVMKLQAMRTTTNFRELWIRRRIHLANAQQADGGSSNVLVIIKAAGLTNFLSTGD